MFSVKRFYKRNYVQKLCVKLFTHKALQNLNILIFMKIKFIDLLTGSTFFAMSINNNYKIIFFKLTYSITDYLIF